MAQPTFRAAYAKYILYQHLEQKSIELGPDEIGPPSLDGHHPWHAKIDADFDEPICIIGAGATGLSVAAMLGYIGFTKVTILEASSNYGGRIYTYNFKLGEGCNHNYYDVGAMRIPDISTQASTFNMINYLNENGQSVTKAPYVYNAKTEPTWYEYPEDDSGFDDYMEKLLISKDILLPPPILIPGGPSSAFSNRSSLNSKPFDDAFAKFMASSDQPDRWSTRGWLMKAPLPDAPQWSYERTKKAETFNTSTGLFDQAFMETICDWFDFNEPKRTKAAWYRIEGGMSKLIDALSSLVLENGVTIINDCPVTAMKSNGKTISVTCAGNPQPAPPNDYAAVFSTTTFGCLQRIDIQGLGLSPDNLCGIRALGYDYATKIAIKFKNPWWQGLIPKGGVSSTDLCIGNVVYPSWNDGPDSAYTIIVSYTWARDATRMAALIHTNDQEGTDYTDPIIQLCLRDLVTLWSNTKYPQTVKGLQNAYSAHHVFSWSNDPYTAGAFAFFGPGQFEYLYPQFTRPLCDDKLLICGEAVSAHHAWISGAFDSAYNAVYTWCTAKGYFDAAQKLKDSPFGGGVGLHTAELDEKLLFKNLTLAKRESDAKGRE